MVSFSLSEEDGLFVMDGGTESGGGVNGPAAEETEETDRNELPDEMDGVEVTDDEIDGSAGALRLRCCAMAWSLKATELFARLGCGIVILVLYSLSSKS